MSIGETVRKVRRFKRISQKDLANRLGIAPNTLYRYECGDRSISLDMLNKIATALEVSADTLLVDSECIPVRSITDDSNNNVSKMALEALEALTEAGKDVATDIKRTKLLSSFDQLNSDGQKVAVERVEELTEIPKYKK